MLSNSSEIKAYLHERLLPLWLEKGLDRKRGGFYDALEANLQPPDRDRKRLLSQCRQIYVFSRAHLRGMEGPALEAAGLGFEFMKEKFWDGAQGGWHFTVTLEGMPLDRRKDTYTFAFVLFALAHYYAASKDSEAMAWVDKTLELLNGKLKDGEQGGYFEGATGAWSLVRETRRQNPHMHLLEAFLALMEARPRPEYKELALSLLRLFRDRFFDKEKNCLREFFGPDWKPAPGEEGRTTEPGHHFEWAWLLRRAARILGESAALPYADQLEAFGRRWGWDPVHGGVYDKVDVEGKVLGDGKRVWPSTEYIKACVSAFQQGRSGQDLDRVREALDYCERRHIDPKSGVWLEHFTRDGGRLTNPERPATSVYHILMALEEAESVLS